MYTSLNTTYYISIQLITYFSSEIGHTKFFTLGMMHRNPMLFKWNHCNVQMYIILMYIPAVSINSIGE